jgi:glycosyl transferase family 2
VTDQRRPTFAAVIAHADEPEMLERCIVHHLAIGVDAVFVSLNLDDEESARVAARFAGEHVRVERVGGYARDPFDYFTSAQAAVVAWRAPDWVLFVDSDEFWLPACGHIAGIGELESSDAFSVQRFNVPPVRSRGGTVLAVDVADLHLPVVGVRHLMDAAFLADHPETSWISAAIVPKLMVRPRVAATIKLGAHEFTSRIENPRITAPRDLLIVHLPFTTEARFRRKVAAIRAMLAAHGARLRGGEGWHWRRWLTIDDEGRLGAEFDAQLVAEENVAALIASGDLTTPARLFADDRLALA